METIRTACSEPFNCLRSAAIAASCTPIFSPDLGLLAIESLKKMFQAEGARLRGCPDASLRRYLERRLRTAERYCRRPVGERLLSHASLSSTYFSRASANRRS